MPVTPKDVVITSALTLPMVTAVLPKQVRVPVVPAVTQSTVPHKDIAQAPPEGLQPRTQGPISAPVVTAHKSATPIEPGNSRILWDSVTGSDDGYSTYHLPIHIFINGFMSSYAGPLLLFREERCIKVKPTDESL